MQRRINKGGIKMSEKLEPSNTRKNQSIITTFRLCQALCFGISALGLAMIAGDLTTAAKSPISTLSMMTTVFGILGSIITGLLANQAKKW
jgi:hypothetical protein